MFNSAVCKCNQSWTHNNQWWISASLAYFVLSSFLRDTPCMRSPPRGRTARNEDNSRHNSTNLFSGHVVVPLRHAGCSLTTIKKHQGKELFLVHTSACEHLFCLGQTLEGAQGTLFRVQHDSVFFIFVPLSIKMPPRRVHGGARPRIRKRHNAKWCKLQSTASEQGVGDLQQLKQLRSRKTQRNFILIGSPIL